MPGEREMTIPEPLRESFRLRMEAADNTHLPLDQWMHAMLAAADEFLAEHHIDWEPRAALVFYLKVPYLNQRNWGQG